MYTLFAFLSLLSLFFFYTAIRQNDRVLWAGFIISTVLNTYTHYFAFFVIFVEVVFFIIVNGKYKNSTKGFMLSLLCIGILFLPQLSGLYSGTLEKTGTKPLWGNEPDISFVPHVLNTLSGGKVILILFIPLFLWGIFKSIKAYREETTLSLAWIFIPILVAFFMAFKMPIVDRYFIFILPLYLILISRGICSIKNRQLMTCLIIAIIAFNGYYLHKQYNTQIGGWKSAAKYLRVNAIPGDVILLIPGEDLCLEYYDIDPERIIILAERNSFPIETREIRSRYDNVWVMYSIYISIRDPKHEIVGWLAQTCNKAAEFDEISIYLCKKDVKKQTP